MGLVRRGRHTFLSFSGETMDRPQLVRAPI